MRQDSDVVGGVKIVWRIMTLGDDDSGREDEGCIGCGGDLSMKYVCQHMKQEIMTRAAKGRTLARAGLEPLFSLARETIAPSKSFECE